jgi:gliding motility-associated-like protein
LKANFAISLLILFSLPSSLFGQLSGYEHYKVITLNSSQIQGSVSLIDFPILISETDAELATTTNGGGVQNSSGFDIKFSLNDGLTPLEHQIESYNPFTGDFKCWVKTPSLPATVDSEIWINYGNSGIISDQSSDLTWDANYKAVFHLTDSFLDGTSNDNDLINLGTTENTTGVVAKGRDFSVGQSLYAPSSASCQIQGDLSVSAWVDINTLQVGTTDNVILEVGGVDETAGENKLFSFNITNTNLLSIHWENGAGVNTDLFSANPIILPGSGLTYLTVTRDAMVNEVQFFQDGSPLDVSATSYATNPTGGGGSNLSIGLEQQVLTNDLDGTLDEIRISDAIRSPDWIATTYNTVSDPSTFYSVGPQISACDASFNYPANTYCLDIDPNPIANITGEVGGIFTGSPAGIVVNVGDGEINLLTSVSGIYTVTYTAPAPFFCQETFNITLNDADDASFSYSATNYCETAPNQLPTSVAAPGGTWLESNPSLVLNPFTGEVLIGSSTDGIYKVYYTTNGLCPVTDSVDFIIEPQQDATFDYDLAYCTPTPNVLPNSIATPGGTFTELTTNLQIVNSTTGELDLDNTIPGTYTLTYVTPNLCATTSNLIFEVLPAINPVFWIPDTVCLPATSINLGDSTIILISETSSYYSYGTSGPANIIGANSDSLDYSTTAPGIYNVTHVVDNGTCQDSSTIQITLAPEYISSTLLLDTVCENIGMTNLNDLFDTGTTSPGGFWQGTGVNNDSLWNLNSLLGDYDLEYIAGLGQCADSSTITINVLPDVDPSWTLPSPICISNGLVDFSLLVTGDSPGTWGGNGMTTSSLNPYTAGVGNHNISYSVGSPFCAETSIQSIVILGLPNSDAGIDSVTCGLDFQMYAVDNGLTGYWYSSSAFTSPDSSLFNATLTLDAYGTHYFYWSEGAGTCQNEDTVAVTFFEQPFADAGADIVLNFTFFTNLDAEVLTVGTGNWTTSEGQTIEDPNNPASMVSELIEGSNVFIWTVYSGFCPTVKDEVLVTVNSIFIPQAISPNDDGVNDTFIIDGLEEQPNTLTIMNRWGQSVYEQENYQNDWKGTNKNGETLQNDTYYYILIVDDTLTFKGYLVLKK